MENKTSRWKQFFSNKLGLIGALMILFFVYVAVCAPLIAPYDPFERVAEPFLPPSSAHYLGTNDVGQDIFSELVYGTRISLFMGLVSALVSIAVGSVVGICAGYCGGAVDAVLMRLVDVCLTIPMLPLMIVLAAFLGSSYWNIILVIGILSWASPARVIRSQVLTVKNRGYIQAVKCLGGRPLYIMRKHVLPQTFSIIVSQFILQNCLTVVTVADGFKRYFAECIAHNFFVFIFEHSKQIFHLRVIESRNVFRHRFSDDQFVFSVRSRLLSVSVSISHPLPDIVYEVALLFPQKIARRVG